MHSLWDKKSEANFFKESVSFATTEDLFYKMDDGRYVAYFPKIYRGATSTLQSRNSLIGQYTEKFCVDLISEIASELGLYAMRGVVCDKLGLSNHSNADVAICKKKETQLEPDDIVVIFEVKMSLVWNWELKISESKKKLACIGDYHSHKGVPGLLRSDSMLKAIGKGINIRVSDKSASRIPIIILGNTPITHTYTKKVDFLKKAGIIQGFWSINPQPVDHEKEFISESPEEGFLTMNSYEMLKARITHITQENPEFFSGMVSKEKLGSLIAIADKEETNEQKAEKFLQLIRE